MLDFQKDKTALVVVDMQNDFVRQDAAMEVSQARDTIPVNQEMIAMARSLGMPVIYTKFVSGPKRVLLWNWSPQIPENNCCVRGFSRYYPDVGKTLDCTDVISELYPEPGDYIIEKYGYSAFRNSSLIDILRANGCDSIVVTGTVTQICVGDTVHDAFHEGLQVLVASDCVSSFDEVQHKATLDNIAMKYGLVETAEQIKERFNR